MSQRANLRSLREAITAHQHLAGTFVKTTHYQTVEVLSGTGLDFIVLDAEHAPFGRESIDACCLAARSGSLPTLVRTATSRSEHILQALDSGANGILVPHVDDAKIASDVVKAARYREAGGERGFSNSPRAGGYGAFSLADHIDKSDRNTAVVVQIETAAGVENVSDIVAVPGIDALFIGRADLAVSFGVNDLNHPNVVNAVEHVCRVARESEFPVGIFLPDTAQAATFMELGVTFFVIGSDQSILKGGVNAVMTSFSAMSPT